MIIVGLNMIQRLRTGLSTHRRHRRSMEKVDV